MVCKAFQLAPQPMESCPSLLFSHREQIHEYIIIRTMSMHLNLYFPNETLKKVTQT